MVLCLLGIAGLSAVILLTRFTSPRGLEELLGFITILPQVQSLPRTTATLERQTDDSKLLSWKEDFITPVFYPRNHPVNTAHSLNMLSAVGHSDVPSISSISALASLLAASPFCSRPCFGMDNIRASAAPVCVSDPHLTELV